MKFKQQSRSWKITFAIFAIILAAAVGLWVYGVSTHDEPTLQSACATAPTGIADYTKNCFEVRWKDLPIEVTAPLDVNDRELLNNVVEAVNDDLGLKRVAFRVLPQGETGTVSIDFHALPIAAMKRSGEVTTHYFTDSMAVRAEIRIINVAFDESRFAVLYHALGHVIGLADENYRGVAMSVPPELGAPYSDYDIDALREIYGKK